MGVNMIPYYAIALAQARHIYLDIDEVYAVRKEEYYHCAKKSEYYSSVIGKEKSLITEEYYKKCVGIIEYFNSIKDDESYEKIYRLFKKAYKKTYSYFKNKTEEEFDLDKYAEDLKSYLFKLDDDDFNNNFTAAIFFTGGKAKNMESITELLELRWNHYCGFRRISNEDIAEKQKTALNSLYRKLPGNIIDKELLSSQKHTIPAIDFIYDLEKLSFGSVFRDLQLSSKDVKDVILAYIEGKGEIDFDSYIIPALHIKAMCKAYNLVKEMYFDNNKETMYVEIGAIKKELSKAREALQDEEANNNQRVRTIEEKNVKLQEENDFLKRRIKELEFEMQHNQSHSKEVIALREYIFKQEVEEMSDCTKIDNQETDEINSIGGIIIGGYPNWQRKIKEYLPDWRYINAGVNTLDSNVIANSPVIIFNTQYLNHSLYYKIMDIVRDSDIHIGYISKTNPENSIKEISGICKNK